MALIDRDALHKIYYGWLSQLDEEKEAGQLEAIQTCLSVLEDAPSVDAVPVVHGEWMLEDDRCFKNSVSKCSACGKRYQLAPLSYNFCPNCGAKMDGGIKDE